MSSKGFSGADFGGLVSHGSLYLSGIAQVDEIPWLLPYAHYLKQAWQELSLAGVLCVDGRPAVYVCEADAFTPQEVTARHHFVWNQGVVPLLILLSQGKAELHTAARKPLRPGPNGELFTAQPHTFIQSIHAAADAVQMAKCIRSIETGHFYQEHAEFFPAAETVDACLVGNLLHTARQLDKIGARGWRREHSHSLLGRVLFVKFLEARGFLKARHFPAEADSLEKILTVKPVEDAKRLLYREFFARMREEFNGTMFDDDLAREERLIQRRHLEVVADFLSVAEMAGRQLTLGFWAYDFRCIPVETISSIYEEFMEGEDPLKKRKDGAVYTPRHLTETTLHIALEGRYGKSRDWRVLDPACGSGIFLGAMFNLLAAQWLRDNPEAARVAKAKALLRILQEQIRGVEINYGACRMAAFSLYLALFEKLHPMDLDEFKAKVRRDRFLPSLVWQAGAEDNPEHKVILHGDFLKDDLPLEKDLDFIIGNPPWAERASKQPALHFTRRVPEFLRPGGLACLLLPSTILVNNHGVLDAPFFRAHHVEKIVQLADFRRVLFQATHPCFVLRFVKQAPGPQDVIAYETPKLNRYDRRRGVIVVEPDDQKSISWPEVMSAANAGRVQSLWSRKFWGTPRDEAFLRRLDAFPTLAEAKLRRKWGGGVGFKPYYPGASRDAPKPLAPDWSENDPFLANDNAFPELVVHGDNLSTLGRCLAQSFSKKHEQEDGQNVETIIHAATDSLHRKPSASVFQGPMVIFSNGFTKFAFSHGAIRFEDSLRSITGNSQSDADALRFVTVVLGSRLMAYHAFHCGSSNGIGRDKLHLHESMSLPFPLPGDELTVPDAAEIIKQAAEILKKLERDGAKQTREERLCAAAAARQELEPLVEAYYAVSDSERVLIEETLLLWKESIHKSNLENDIPAIAFPGEAERKLYADTLCGELARFSRKPHLRISAEGRVSQDLQLVLMTVIFSGRKTDYQEIEGDPALWQALQKMDAAAAQDNGRLHYLRGFTYFEPDRIHILKPATLRNWSRTAALNDADAIFERQFSHRA